MENAHGPGAQVRRPDTAVVVGRAAREEAASETDVNSNGWLMVPTLALALLSCMTAACFNPTYIGQPVPRENHVPVVEAFPAPSFEPIQADVGAACAPLTLSITQLQDADGDVLTVRFDALINRNGRAARVLLRESPPLSPLETGDYPLTALTTLVLDEDLLGARLGDLDRQMDPRNNLTQLIELRVSDAGFVADENGDPVADGDGGVVFLSWMVRLTECGVEP